MERKQKELSDLQYGPFLEFIKDDRITDVDYNGKELWVEFILVIT